jgi:sterol desaturase/sphingolipid hydroxylase (fatty acid hydroxylase superfamily)
LDLAAVPSYFLERLGQALLAPGSSVSLASLSCALLIACAIIAARRYRKSRRIHARTLIRALFPKSIVLSRSTLTDVGYLYFNIFVFGIVFGWAPLSYEMLSRTIVDQLTALFGPMPPAPLPALVSRTIITVMLFLAYELGYWLNHYLSHRIPFLWEFHKVHYTATVLTPVTNFRVHPVYMCIFFNILAIFTGLASGLGEYLLGGTTHQYGLSENNIILVFFIYVYVHLQHSQVWIAFTGWLGRLFMSPAHHQIHHSSNPAHFNKNLGSCLALWDWMFGTLHVPSAEREVAAFGVEADRPDAHTLRGELIAPFGKAALRLRELLAGRAPRPASLPAPDQTRA